MVVFPTSLVVLALQWQLLTRGCAANGQEDARQPLTEHHSWGTHSTVLVRPDLRISGLRLPNHPDAIAWLETYYEDQLYREQGPLLPKEGSGVCTSPQQPRFWAGPTGCSRQYFPGGLPPASRGIPGAKRNLILVPVGDRWDPAGKNKWMQHPEAANFDIVVGYFGRKTAFNCTVCVRQARTRGGPWPILVDLTRTDFWEEILASGYEYVWLADDDLVMDTCALNTFFDYMKQYDLILAQPSVCNSTDEVPSASAMPYIHQKAEFLLRYLTVVEIMGPAMRMDYFHNVFRHLINASHLGWGLDWIMPAQLLYPRDKIAVVDAVCMVHPPRCMGGGHLHPKHIDPKLLECKRAGSAYRARGVPRDPLVEENALFRAYNYTRVTTLELGYEYRDEGYWLGSIPNPRFRPPGANKPLLTPRDPGEGGQPPPFGCSSHQLQAAAEGRHLRRQQLQEEGSGGGSSSSGSSSAAGFGAAIGACGWLPATALVVLLPLAALLTLGRVRKGAGGRAPPGLPGLLRKLRPTTSNGHAVL